MKWLQMILQRCLEPSGDVRSSLVDRFSSHDVIVRRIESNGRFLRGREKRFSRGESDDVSIELSSMVDFFLMNPRV